MKTTISVADLPRLAGCFVVFIDNDQEGTYLDENDPRTGKPRNIDFWYENRIYQLLPVVFNKEVRDALSVAGASEYGWAFLNPFKPHAVKTAQGIVDEWNNPHSAGTRHVRLLTAKELDVLHDYQKRQIQHR